MEGRLDSKTGCIGGYEFVQLATKVLGGNSLQNSHYLDRNNRVLSGSMPKKTKATPHR